MARLDTATRMLRELEVMLRTTPRGAFDPSVAADRVAEVLDLLSREQGRWVGTTEAKRLLGVGSENTVKAWARLGLLRSRRLPNGRTQVLLDDVLRRRAEDEALLAIGGDDLTPEELEEIEAARPETNPCERVRTTRAS
jgi:hypothetical protein